jgi:hypothetical protein
MYSEDTVKNYLQLLEKINQKRKGIFNTTELSEILDVSRPVMIKFLKGETIRFDLLEQVGAMVGYDFWFDLTLKG